MYYFSGWPCSPVAWVGLHPFRSKFHLNSLPESKQTIRGEAPSMKSIPGSGFFCLPELWNHRGCAIKILEFYLLSCKSTAAHSLENSPLIKPFLVYSLHPLFLGIFLLPQMPLEIYYSLIYTSVISTEEGWLSLIYPASNLAKSCCYFIAPNSLCPGVQSNSIVLSSAKLFS